ncbi:hypothetical protein F5Y03DRAFT_338110 [Xylaria venustula]|nr:hypothetical protein F5Y03DRAFT_338110 [Xylaria venustula]
MNIGTCISSLLDLLLASFLLTPIARISDAYPGPYNILLIADLSDSVYAMHQISRSRGSRWQELYPFNSWGANSGVILRPPLEAMPATTMC